MTTKDPLEGYVDFLIKQSGGERLPDAFRISFREKLLYEVQRRIGTIALSELDEKDVPEFVRLFGDNPTPDQSGAMQKFLDSHIKNFPKKLQAGLEEFTEQYLAISQGD